MAGVGEGESRDLARGSLAAVAPALLSEKEAPANHPQKDNPPLPYSPDFCGNDMGV